MKSNVTSSILLALLFVFTVSCDKCSKDNTEENSANTEEIAQPAPEAPAAVDPASAETKPAAQ